MNIERAAAESRGALRGSSSVYAPETCQNETAEQVDVAPQAL